MLVQLVRSSRQNIDVWDFQQQRMHATRFYVYLMLRIIVMTSGRGAGSNDEERIARLGLADCASAALASLTREDPVDRHWEVMVGS